MPRTFALCCVFSWQAVRLIQKKSVSSQNEGVHETRMRRILRQNLMLTANSSLIVHHLQAADSELFNLLVFHSRLARTGERQKNNADQAAPDANSHGAGPAKGDS